MNGLSLSDLCCLFCCPPLPSRIVAKLAFLPPVATYKLIVNDTQEYVSQVPSINQQTEQNEQQTSNLHSYACNLYNTLVCKNRSSRLKNEKIQNVRITNAQLQLLERSEWQFGPESEKLEAFFCKTERGHKIACMYIRCTQNPKYTILFSHGNAVDLGQMSSFYYGLGVRLECNIFTYDYSGYGASEGKPNEQNLYSDIKAAWNALRTRYNVSPTNIIMYGQSIGTVPTVDLASKVDCGGIVLHAPLMSGMRVAFNTKRTWCCDAFPSIDKVNKIGSLVLVIHGTDDEVIDMSHGVAIHQKCRKPVDPLWVEGAGHNDVEIYSQYVDRLKRFINNEIAKHHTVSQNEQKKAQTSEVKTSQQELSSSNVTVSLTNTEDSKTPIVGENTQQ